MSTPTPPRETGKQRSIRIPLDYYKGHDFLQHWKVWLAVAALAIAVGWLALTTWGRAGGRYDYSRGPVAAVHATWENDCEACHVPFSPIAERKWIQSTFGSAHASNQRCESCHAGPAHHANVKPDLSCASCHRDHQGRDHRLVQARDADCTQCHNDLKDHLTAKSAFEPPIDNAVTFFPDEKRHPKFRSIKGDPGRLKFSHEVHMARGLVIEKGGKTFTLGQVADADRERYRGRQERKDNADPVQLNCASCHVLDGADLHLNRKDHVGADVPAPRAAGLSMLPIQYDNHCKGCHPLTFDPPPDRLTKDKDPPAPKLPPVPHHLQTDQVHAYLWNTYAAQFFADNPSVLEKFTPPRPLPMGRELTQEVKTGKGYIEAKVAEAQKVLYLGKQTCAECHHFTGKPEAGPVNGEAVKFKVVPPDVPDVWFRHASFDHSKHHALDCRACHDKAYTSKESGDVLVPDADNCRQCHAPAVVSRGGVTQHGGARFNCTECHRYHNGDHSMQGPGALRRGPKDGRLLNVEQLLQGGRGK